MKHVSKLCSQETFEFEYLFSVYHVFLKNNRKVKTTPVAESAAPVVNFVDGFKKWKNEELRKTAKDILYALQVEHKSSQRLNLFFFFNKTNVWKILENEEISKGCGINSKTIISSK